MRFFNTEGPVQARDHCIPPLESCGAEWGHLIVFDRSAERTWKEKMFRREAPAGDGAAPVTVWGM